MEFHGLLVSSGFSALAIRKKVANLAKTCGYKKAHIITTARPEKEKAPWVPVTKAQLEEMGMTVSFVDFDAGESLDDDVDVIYVCGGNTFHLLHSIQTATEPIQEQIKAMCERGGLYIGSSAGAVLVSPTIASAGEVCHDKNSDNISDMTGLHYIKEHIIPHYTPAYDKEIARFRKKHALAEDEVIVLRDGEGVYIKNGTQTIISDKANE